MRDWLEETHGASFELFRHFLARFFESELVSHPGQTTAALVGSASMFLVWFPFVTGPLKDKYARLSALPSPGPYRHALQADELWLITLTMALVGLLTALEWRSLLPGIEDYRAIGWLPVRARQVFGAKLAALVTVASAAVVTLNLLPCVGLPALSAGRWAFTQSLGVRAAATGAASALGCYFCFFALVGIEGVLLNLLPRGFLRITGAVQGLLTAGMLIVVVLSFSIGPPFARAALRPEVARWLPPAWFTGLCERISGNPDGGMRALAREALGGLMAAVLVVLATYTASYRRHRVLLVEGVAAPRREGHWRTALFGWLVRDPYRQAVVGFVGKALAGSGLHRMVLMGYAGFGVAIFVSSAMGMANVVGPSRVWAARFVCGHVTMGAFLLIGVRHVFAIPVDPKANWIFRLTEREGRLEWMRAIDRLVLGAGAVALVAIPFPVEVWLLGWRAVSEALLAGACGLAVYQGTFLGWEKMPFTCTYLPGKKPMWIVALRLMGLLVALPVVSALLLECQYNPVLFAAVGTALAAAAGYLHGIRKSGWSELRLRFEESPERAVESLQLLK